MEGDYGLFQIVDENSFVEIDVKGEMSESEKGIIIGRAEIKENPIAIGWMINEYLMGSMGYEIGEKVTRLFEYANQENLPVIIYCTSGGARIFEGVVSLMQMAKTAMAAKQHSQKGLLYISVLGNPTMGGVLASYASVGDIVIGEKSAIIGFAGARVVDKTIGKEINTEIQSAESYFRNGFCDMLVDKEELKLVLGQILSLHEVNYIPRLNGHILDDIPCRCKYSNYEKLKMIRANNRLTTLELIEGLFTNFIELHGDRHLGDDSSIIGGIANFKGIPITVIGQQRGQNIKERIHRNFGMTKPAGFGKALRLMKQAEKFQRPIVCFIDTMGADCDERAEKEGQALAIARNISEMSQLKVPILSIILSEANSGGALALGIADEVWMMENALYSILSPEAFLAIARYSILDLKDIVNSMKISSYDMYDLHIIDGIIREGVEGEEPQSYIRDTISNIIENFLGTHINMPKDKLLEIRHSRFRKF